MPIPNALPFQRGTTYHRRKDIHAQFGGQQQGGISTPTNRPLIFLFTGNEGEAFGYKDGWDTSGVFRYTGEGQHGDMKFVAGNKAIRDHAQNGKDLLLFQTLGKGKPVRYLGRFVLSNYELIQMLDKVENARQGIVFHLVPVEDEASSDIGRGPPAALQAEPLESLRRKAYEAAMASKGPAGKIAQRTYRERSDAVRRYVLERAAGTCESCGSKAPFVRADNTPYLEPHHIRRLSDGGPDHPAYVAAICPNCHREIHAGRNGASRNSELRERITRVEADHDPTLH